MDINSITIGTSLKITTAQLFGRGKSDVRVMTVTHITAQGSIITPLGPIFHVESADGKAHSIDTNTGYAGARHAHQLNSGATTQGCSIAAA